jgi:hypothetical protein
LFTAYVETKQRHKVVDYDDLLLYWAQAVSEGPVGPAGDARRCWGADAGHVAMTPRR